MNTSIPALTPSLMQEVDALFAEWDKPDSPGCALGIIRDGELIYANGYGIANLEHDVPITPRSVFRIASTSKQFTAACVALLVEVGAVSLEDDIHRYLPELPELGVPVTIRHLLHHTSGWRDYIELMELRGMRDDDFYTDKDVLELLARQHRLNFSPGEDFIYSNTGYYMLGVIVQRASGLSLRQYARENIFKPLGMANTHFHDDHTEIVKGLAQGYAPREQGGYHISMTTLDLVGDGGVFTTIEDLFLWDQNFYHNKLGRGGSELLDMLQTPGVKNNGQSLTYAFGLEVKDYKGLRMVCHSGGFVGYRAELIRFPELCFSVICLANLSTFDPSKLSKRVADLFLGDSFTEKAPMFEAGSQALVEVDEKELVDKAGLYWSPEKDVILEVSVEAGKLLVEAAGRRFDFEALSAKRFRSCDAPFQAELRFERHRTDMDWGLYLIVEDEEPVLLTHIAAVELIPPKLSPYAGRFYSQELDTAYQIGLLDEALHLETRSGHSGTLRPALPDMFWLDERVFRFIRNGENPGEGFITGFTLNSARVKDIYFQRVS